MFREKLEKNTSLIDFDFSGNSFTMEDSRAIQEILKRNKAAYDAERLKEWKERKLMRHENDKLGEHFLAEKSKLEEERMAE